MSRILSRVCPAVLLFALVGGPLHAQQIRIGIAQVWSNHDLLGDPAGLGLFITLPARANFPVRLGYEFLAGKENPTGVPCAGLIEPGTCAPEPLRQSVRVHALSAALPLALLREHRIDLRLVPGVRATRLSGDRHGLESGRSLSAGEYMWGADLGGEAELLPLPRWPARLHLSAQAGLLKPFLGDRSEDGYEPFRRMIPLARLEVGVSYALRSRK